MTGIRRSMKWASVFCLAPALCACDSHPEYLSRKISWFFRGKCQRIFVYWNRPRLISNRPWGFGVKIANFSRLHCLAVTNWLKPNESKTKCRKMSRKPWSHVRVLIYRTWAIVKPQGKKFTQYTLDAGWIYTFILWVASWFVFGFPHHIYLLLCIPVFLSFVFVVKIK